MDPPPRHASGFDPPTDLEALDRAELIDRLRALERRTRLTDQALARMNEGLIVTDATRYDNPIIYTNPGFSRLTGYSADEVLGHNCRFLQGERTSPVARAELRAAVRAGRDTTVDLVNYRKDGTPFWNRISIAPVHDDEGRLVNFVGLQTDVSAQREAEQALAASRASFHSIVERSDLGVLVLDTEQRVRYANPAAARLLGREAVEMLDRPLDLPREAGRIVELARRDLAGNERILELSATATEWNERAAHLLTLRDVTEARRARHETELQQQQLIQADKMVSLGILVAGVAHEVNNPNSSIMLNIPLLREAWVSALEILDRHHAAHGDFQLGPLRYSQMRGHVLALHDEMLAGSERIKQIVSDLKDYARLNPRETFADVEINEVVRSAVTLLRNMIERHTTRFTVRCGEDLPTLRGNAQRIEQVIINLMQNACQALTAPTQALEIETAYDAVADRVLVIVRDEGAGIAPEHMAHLTDPFFTTKRTSGGTGLGLSVSSKIVKAHGGTMEFESQPGRGTTVALRLPTRTEDTGP